ncbi:hypothetical protein BVX98_01825 [bacterium F11]|nr:hypothetical protein BVX98_01825 [bacterium F11]
MKALSITLDLLGGLAVFLYGMKVMSEGLQKAAGRRLRQLLNMATKNRMSSTLVGFLVTCAVQSSSATTVMVVSFVSAGLLSLYQSLGIIFGANIGTTTTGWIVSLLGFKVKVTKFALPIIGIGFFSQFIRRWRWPHRIGEVLVGFGLLFLGLSIIKQTIPNLTDSPFVTNLIGTFGSDQLGPRLMLVLLGALFTMIFQSSSAMMAVTLAAAATGLIGYKSAVALVLGENIGTTITANLAAIGAPLNARRAAVGHFFFNILGVIWAVVLFNPFVRLVDFLIPGNPFAQSEQALLLTIPTHIAAFHTIFNIVNTMVALMFIRHLERFIMMILPERKARDESDLLYLSTPLSDTPELAVEAAQKEVERMTDVVIAMLEKVVGILDKEVDRKKLDKTISSILQDEKVTDQLEHKINAYLSKLTHGHLSTASNRKVLSLLSMINDLERMGDHGEKLATLFNRSKEQNLQFSQQGLSDLKTMAVKALETVRPIKEEMAKTEKEILDEAILRENQLNDLRYRLRGEHIDRITKGTCDPYAGIIFSDMLTSFEKIGDHAFNVVEASVGIK